MDPEDHITAMELAEAGLGGLTRFGRSGLGQALDALVFAAVAAGVDPRSELPRKLTRLRMQGLVPALRSTRTKAIHEARLRAEAVLRQAVLQHLRE